jgi:hypothetical protein
MQSIVLFGRDNSNFNLLETVALGIKKFFIFQFPLLLKLNSTVFKMPDFQSFGLIKTVVIFGPMFLFGA